MAENEENNQYFKLKDLSKQLSQERQNKFKNIVTTLVEDEREAADEPKTVLPESVFVEFFLPYFIELARTQNDTQNDKKLAKNFNDNLLGKWIDMAKGPYNEVDVMDNAGNIIFTVPALFSKNVVMMENVKSFDFLNMTRTYNRKLSVNPTQATNYLYSSFSGVPKFLKNPNDDLSRQEKWANIFKRYMKKPEEKKDEIQNTAKAEKIKKRIREDLGIDLDD